jgi:hypothetical protein
MKTFTLEDSEAQSLLNIVAQTTQFPWIVTNPLVQKLGQQMQAQEPAGAQSVPGLRPNGPDREEPADSKRYGGLDSRQTRA